MRVLDEISWCDKFTGSVLGKLNLAIGASSAEIEDSWWLLCYKWALSRLGLTGCKKK